MTRKERLDGIVQKFREQYFAMPESYPYRGVYGQMLGMAECLQETAAEQERSGKVTDRIMRLVVDREAELQTKIKDWESLWSSIRSLVEDSGEVTVADPREWERLRAWAERLTGYAEERLAGLEGK